MVFSNRYRILLFVLLLTGIECPRGARNGPNGVMKGDPFADEALAFTKDLVMNREVNYSLYQYKYYHLLIKH